MFPSLLYYNPNAGSKRAKDVVMFCGVGGITVAEHYGAMAD
jgi:hypothetical protein